jgi:rhamnosyltransferase
MKASNAMKVSLIIPTYDPGQRAVIRLLAALEAQTRAPDELLIVDSGSTDGTPEVWRAHGARVHAIAQRDFDHGGTRNLAARLARGDLLAFLTQDAVPAHDEWLDTLIAPLTSGMAAATYARQLPGPDASPLESFARRFNYPATSQLKRRSDVARLGVKAFFFSNACSALLKAALLEVGMYPERTIVNEDYLLAAKLIAAGHAVFYNAEARVQHSHAYTLKQQAQRSFDIGVSLARGGGLVAGVRAGGEGGRYLVEQLRFLWREGHRRTVPYAVLEAALRYTTFQLGRREAYLPRALKRRLSMHRYFWDQEP